MARPLKYPIDFVPLNSYLIFIKQTVKGQTINKKIFAEKALYQCKCGTYCESLTNNVKFGKKISCGCKNLESLTERGYVHGFSEHPLYTVWENMLTRCYNKKVKAYPNYGGRGVRMCDEWHNHPEKFIEWALKNGWRKGLQLDKDIKAKEFGIDALLYSPEMCQFVTPKRNGNNTRSNRNITYNSKTQTLAQWADELGMFHTTLHNRLKKWTLKEALTRPLNDFFYNKLNK